MKNFTPLIVATALAAGPLCAVAQTTIKGTVTDGAKGDRLPGVSIVVKGTTRGTTSNSDGSYALALPTPDATLIFSFVGYQTVERKVNGQNTLDVGLAEQKALDEVVVVGYGSVKRSDLTGSVATVKTEDLLKTIPTSINQGLQGQVAGVAVNRSDGAPGGGISLTIRGANSLSGNTEPLYVIDGIPYIAPAASAASAGTGIASQQSTNALSFLNPQDIASMEILKDASATAIYGARGANGVVLIQTKKGQAGTDKVEVIANTTISQIAKRIKVLDAYQYALFQNEAYQNSITYNGAAPTQAPFPGITAPDPLTGKVVRLPAPEDYLTGLQGTSYPDGFTGTNWQDQILRTAVTKDYTVRMSGGSDKGGYSISGNVLDQQGIVKNSSFTRYGLQVNVNRKLFKWLEFGTSNNVSFSNYNLAKSNSNGNEASLISSALVFPPTFPTVVDAAALARENNVSWYAAANPLTYLQQAKDQTASTSIYSANYLQVQFTPSLSFRQNIGVNFSGNNREVYYGRRLQEGRTVNGSAFVSDDTWRALTLESLLSFNKTFGKDHSVNAVVGATRENNSYYMRNMSATGFPDDLLQDNSIGNGANQRQLNSSKSDGAIMSLLGRINYSYKGRYMATVSFRRDGSSRFSETNKYASFPSFSVGWNVNEERFMQGMQVFSTLKLRGGYGQTGSQAIGAYGTLALLYYTPYVAGGSLQPGYSDNPYIGPADPNLRWETTGQTNIGLDLGFMQNRFTFTVDVYRKLTRDLLQRISLNPSSGSFYQQTNFGSVENKGLELSGVGTVLSTQQFKWSVNANISFNRNKLQDLPGDQYAPRLYFGADQFFLQRNGQPIGAILGYVEDGFYDNLAEVKADPQFANQSEATQRQQIGEIKYKNLDSDPTSISASDRTIIGNTNPKYSYGVTNNFSYRNFNLSVFVQGVEGNDIINSNLYQIRMGQVANIPQFVYDGRWTPETAATATWPKPLTADTRQARLSNRLVEDGSYVRLKNINFGYVFNKPLPFIDSINLYGAVGNVFTISKYSWYDADVSAFAGDATRRGVDMNSYPTSRTYTLGLRLGF
ncbi:SusC/RagA family TonB-linked outer membrane protein [Hymenobacter bucti]|uniref:SusC/RagA family TonB-linked outer membrane protein n=1 Tax=Hymenobacter bucti TaxID=1844114 RepID=A0ABW4R046_9BACT